MTFDDLENTSKRLNDMMGKIFNPSTLAQPFPFDVRPSAVHGEGLFATQDLKVVK
jgi:hypothetical protein